MRDTQITHYRFEFDGKTSAECAVIVLGDILANIRSDYIVKVNRIEDMLIAFAKENKDKV